MLRRQGSRKLQRPSSRGQREGSATSAPHVICRPTSSGAASSGAGEDGPHPRANGKKFLPRGCTRKPLHLVNLGGPTCLLASPTGDGVTAVTSQLGQSSSALIPRGVAAAVLFPKSLLITCRTNAKSEHHLLCATIAMPTEFYINTSPPMVSSVLLDQKALLEGRRVFQRQCGAWLRALPRLSWRKPCNLPARSLGASPIFAFPRDRLTWGPGFRWGDTGVDA